jgi:hypothetical protein
MTMKPKVALPTSEELQNELDLAMKEVRSVLRHVRDNPLLWAVYQLATASHDLAEATINARVAVDSGTARGARQQVAFARSSGEALSRAVADLETQIGENTKAS